MNRDQSGLFGHGLNIGDKLHELLLIDRPRLVLVPVVLYRTLGENRFLSLAGALSTVLTVFVVIGFSVYLYPLAPDHANMDDDDYIFDMCSIIYMFCKFSIGCV